MILYQKFHNEKLYRFFKSELWQFELSVWIHVFGQSMVSIFTPIFLLQAGYSIKEVILFYVIFNIFDAPLNFVAKNLTYKYGAKKVIALGTLSYIVFFLLLLNLPPHHWPWLIALALFMALYDTLFWVSHIYFFMSCSPNDDNVSEDTSFLYIIKRIAGFLAPILGALILIFFSEKILILVSISILLISLWPLNKIKHSKDKPNKKPLSLREFFQTKEDLKEYILVGLQSFHGVADGVIWPIFIYTVYNSIESVAIIPIIVSVATIIFTFFTGKVKKDKRESIITLGAFFIALVWILRMIITNEIFYYISVFLTGMFIILISLPLESIIFEKGEKKNALSASAYRNFFSMFPRIFFYGFLYIFLDVFKISFLSAALSMLLIVVVSYLSILASKKVSIKNKKTYK